MVFVVRPEVFYEMAVGGIDTVFLFLLLVFIAGLSSAISLAEVSVSFAMRQVNLSRGKAVLIIGALITALGIPSALSQGGPLSDFLIFDLSFLDLVDTITDSYFLP